MGYHEVVPFHTDRPLAPWEVRGPRPRPAARADVALAASGRLVARGAPASPLLLCAPGGSVLRGCVRVCGEASLPFDGTRLGGYDDGG